VAINVDEGEDMAPLLAKVTKEVTRQWNGSNK